MILDATAGNRTMWEHKNSQHIIYIDIEKKLMRKPTIYADNTKTPFQNNTFNTIFYDPPHNWGGKDEPRPIYPSEIKKWKAKHEPFAFTYYGWDKYKSRAGLIKHIYNAQKEFQRILKPDGLLWFKWNEIRIPLYRVLAAFNQWTTLITLRIIDPTHTYSPKHTYWVCMCKKQGKTSQLPLETYLQTQASNLSKQQAT